MNSQKILVFLAKAVIVVEVCGIALFLFLSFQWWNDGDWTGLLPLLGVAVMAVRMFVVDIPRHKELTTRL